MRSLLRWIPFWVPGLWVAGAVLGLIFLAEGGYEGTVSRLGATLLADRGPDEVKELLTGEKFEKILWFLGGMAVISGGILIVLIRFRKEVIQVWEESLDLTRLPGKIWSEIPLEIRWIFGIGLGFLFALKLIIIFLMPLSGDEAAFFYTHVRRSPLVPLVYLNNHPLHLFLSSLLNKIHLPDQLALRLPSLGASMALSWVVFIWFWHKGKERAAWLAALSVQIIAPLMLYSLDGKSYLLALLFLVFGGILLKKAGSKSEGYEGKYLVWIFLFLCLSVWSNPGFVFSAGGLLLAFWVWTRPRLNLNRIFQILGWIFGLGAALACLYGPALLLELGGYFEGMSKAESQTFGSWLAALGNELGWIYVGNEQLKWLIWVEWPLIILLVVLAGRSERKVNDKSFSFFGAAALLSLLLGLASGIFPPVRLFILLPFGLALGGMAFEQVKGKWAFQISCSLLTLLLIWNGVQVSREIQPRIQEKEDYHALMGELEKLPQGKSLTIQSWQIECMLAYYYLKSGRERPDWEVIAQPLSSPGGWVMLDHGLESDLGLSSQISRRLESANWTFLVFEEKGTEAPMEGNN
ncbi:MAG: hypothetical protein H6581_22000 [Bacteroidia bacterium]|nr:hypothetical protein [Bacteroidia bacterium]